jgi:hypothetical protein
VYGMSQKKMKGNQARVRRENKKRREGSSVKEVACEAWKKCKGGWKKRRRYREEASGAIRVSRSQRQRNVSKRARARESKSKSKQQPSKRSKRAAPREQRAESKAEKKSRKEKREQVSKIFCLGLCVFLWFSMAFLVLDESEQRGEQQRDTKLKAQWLDGLEFAYLFTQRVARDHRGRTFRNPTTMRQTSR